MVQNTSMPKSWGELHFEARQAAWTGQARMFIQRHGRSDRAQYWEIWVQGRRYYTRHGKLDGKLQETSKRGQTKNRGKANEITPEQDALAEARRLARKKWDFEGYDEVILVDGQLVNIDHRNEDISIPHLLADLPSSFSMYKPYNTIYESKKLLQKAEEGEVFYTRKRNGLAFWAVVDAFNCIRLYSRRNRKHHKDEGPKEDIDGTLVYDNIIEWTVRFPHIVEAVRTLLLPPNTMLNLELVHPAGDAKDHFRYVASVEKSLTERAIEIQNENCPLNAYWWDIPFYNGEDLVSTRQVQQRHALMMDLWHRALEIDPIERPALGYIEFIDVQMFSSPKEAEEKAKELGYEGWVVVDPKGIYGDRAWNLRGKPDRPREFSAKLKPWFEDDFVVYFDPESGWGEWGKGRHERGKKVELPNGEEIEHGGVGSVGLGQYDSQGNLVYCCKMSSGMDYELQAQLRPQDFPQVWEVSYVDRSYRGEKLVSDSGTVEYEQTNALQHPKLFRVRDDKRPEECINQRLG